MENTVAVMFPKGGVGKTTTAVNLAGVLVSLGHSVLLVDDDWQGSATVHLGIKEPDDIHSTLADVLAGRIPAERAIRQLSNGIHLLPGNGELANVDLELLAQGEAGVYRMREVLDSVAEKYDVVLIDCEPGMSIRNLGALAAANYLLVPVGADYLSLKPLKLFLRVLAAAQKRYAQMPRHQVGYLVTRYDSRQSQATEILEILKKMAPQVGMVNMETTIPERAVHRKAAAAGGPLTEIHGHEAQDLTSLYSTLAKKVLEW